jgi:uncharacterized protein (TIGR03435 family)
MRMRPVNAVYAVLFLASALATQTAGPEFEAASIKPAGPSGPAGDIQGKIIGGPGTGDPIQLRGKSVTLFTLIRTAYDVPSDQISGAAWLQNERYDLTAKVPRGATKDDVKAMLRTLLAERFRLAVHREPKEFPVYELTVAKGGARLKATAYPDATPLRPWESGSSANLDGDGYPAIQAGRSGAKGVPANGSMRWTFQALPVSDLVKNIEGNLGSLTGLDSWAPGRVLDKTELTGKYDFKIVYASNGQIGDVLQPKTGGASATQQNMLDVPDPGGGPDLFTALEKQLGLKLTKTKAMFEALVVDRAERVPSGN